jgi:hypothetical protein
MDSHGRFTEVNEVRAFLDQFDMRNKLERDVEAKAVAWATAQGILVLKLNLIGNTGWPDRVFLHRGRQVYIEFKRPGDDLERNQPERIEELVKQGFTVGVFDDARTAASFLGATLLSESWRQANDQSGVCWVALQARSWQDQRGLYGVPHFAGQGLRR